MKQVERNFLEKKVEIVEIVLDRIFSIFLIKQWSSASSLQRLNIS